MAPPLPRSPAARTSRHLGRYELIGELARGGMGTVYLARHAGEAGFQRLFAIKVMHAHLAEERAFVDMLRDEARIAARIHHPHVVAIVDLGIHQGMHYVVMDYVEGPPFGTLLKRGGGPDAIPAIVQVLTETLEGLHAAHTLTDDDGEQLHLVHRDVSPQNILVGVDGVARITDFGIAKAETRITSTQPGMRKGKLAFMAPEQITGGDAVDCRADIWAVGVVLWSALTGKSLFRGENDAATIHNVLTREIPPPSQEGHKPPSHFDEIVLRALQRDPALRFSSAMEMADALRQVAAEQRLIGSKQRIAKWVNDTFGEELGLRRKAIRETAQRRAENDYSDTSQVNVLPGLPATGGGSSILSGVSGVLTRPGDTGVTGSFPAGASEPSSLSLEQPTISIIPASVEPAPKRRVLPLVVIGLVAAGALGFVLMRSSDEAPPAAPAVAQTKTTPVAEPAPALEAAPAAAIAPASAEKARAEAPEAESEPSVEEAPAESATTNKATEPRARRTTRRAAPQRAPAPRAVARPEPAKPAPEPPAPPAAAEPPAKPRPAATTETLGLDRNPYIRR